jgi:hypothetical protein
MEHIFFAVFNKLTHEYDIMGADCKQELILSQQAYDELRQWVIKEDEEWNDIVFKKQYSDETYKPHKPMLPLFQEENIFPFNGYLFKLIIK